MSNFQEKKRYVTLEWPLNPMAVTSRPTRGSVVSKLRHFRLPHIACAFRRRYLNAVGPLYQEMSTNPRIPHDDDDQTV